MDEKTNINLEELSDKHKMLLSQLSYLDINEEGAEKIKAEGLTVEQLSDYLDANYADKPYLGNLMPELGYDIGTGKGTITTEREFLNELIDEGLGDLKITDITSNDKGIDSVTNGLQAMAFEAPDGSIGISYRGSDFDKDAIGDWASADVGEYLTNESAQAKEANDFFEKNKNEEGKNYIYGHSLGGNLTTHTYVENYDEIKEAFTINGTPINTNELSDEQIAALNDSKYNCNVVGLDPVSQLKDYSDYADNVNYIANNGEQGNNPIYAHTVQAATYDENGNFILEESKEKAYEGEAFISKAFTSVAENVHTGIHQEGGIVDKFKEMTSEVAKEKEQSSDSSNTLSGLWEKAGNFFKKASSKAGDFIKNIYSKGKKFILNIGKEETKLLPSGQEREQTSASIINTAQKSNNFLQSMKLDNWISETYTKEQADNAQRISDNPEKLIEQMSAQKPSNQLETKAPETVHEM